MIPPFDAVGNLPPGVHEATWEEFVARFGTTPRRLALLAGLKAAMDALRAAGCRRAYIDGSFVTAKPDPGDFDGRWDTDGVDPTRLDPVLLRFDRHRQAQKARYGGELFFADARGPGGDDVHRLLSARPRRPVEGHRRTRPRSTTVIANEVQRRVTQTAIREFEEALARLDEDAGDSPEWVRKGLREGMESQLADLRAELAEYGALRSGQVRELQLRSLRELPEALIRARIAAGLSQKELARRLGLKEQQIQRYEATRYAGVSLERVQAVADALGVQLHERVVLPTPNAR